MSDAVLAALLGLLTALCFGLGSFAGQRLTARLGWLRAAWVGQASALPLVAAAALVLDGAPERSPALWHALGLGLLNVLSVIALYRAFAAGALAIVAPISSSYAAVTVALAFIAGEPPSLALTVGLVAVVAGVAVVAAVRGGDGDGGGSRTAGVAWAGLSSLCFGAVFFWLEPVSGELGPVWPIALMRASGVAALGALRGALGPVKPGRVPALLLAACVVLDTGGLLFYSLGVRLGGAAVLTVLASLSSVVAVLLGRMRLGERLATGQWIGVGLVLAGTAWISYCSHLE